MLRNPRLLRGRRERPHRRRAAKQIDIGDLHDRIGKAGPTFRSSPGADDRSRPGGDGAGASLFFFASQHLAGMVRAEICFLVGLLCVPFAWLVWYFAPSLR